MANIINLTTFDLPLYNSNEIGIKLKILNFVIYQVLLNQKCYFFNERFLKFYLLGSGNCVMCHLKKNGETWCQGGYIYHKLTIYLYNLFCETTPKTFFVY